MKCFYLKKSQNLQSVLLFLFWVLATNVFSKARKMINFDNGWQFIKEATQDIGKIEIKASAVGLEGGAISVEVVPEKMN